MENLAHEENYHQRLSSCSSLGRSAQFDPASSCSGQLLRSSSGGSSSVPSGAVDQGKIGLELGNFNARKGKKKNRRRLVSVGKLKYALSRTFFSSSHFNPMINAGGIFSP